MYFKINSFLIIIIAIGVEPVVRLGIIVIKSIMRHNFLEDRGQRTEDSEGGFFSAALRKIFNL
ncbi:hypothetical protein Ccar_22765 [Clostridium carboxidivorans P7]|nr:hypothetical protein Ccar_22765 [Clostridium carboxidivorans P7]